MITDRPYSTLIPAKFHNQQTEGSRSEQGEPANKKRKSEADAASEGNAANTQETSNRMDTALKLLDSVLQNLPSNTSNTARDFFFHSIGVNPDTGDESKWQAYKNFHNQQLDGLLSINRASLQDNTLRIISYPNVKDELKRNIVSITDKLLTMLAQFHEQAATKPDDSSESTSISEEDTDGATNNDISESSLESDTMLTVDMNTIASAYAIKTALDELCEVANNDHYFNNSGMRNMFC